MGGQLQRWENGFYDKNGSLKDLGVPDAPSIMPRMAKLTDDMLEFSEEVQTIVIIDEDGNPILTKDLERRFFEAPWIHKYNVCTICPIQLRYTSYCLCNKR